VIDFHLVQFYQSLQQLNQRASDELLLKVYFALLHLANFLEEVTSIAVLHNHANQMRTPKMILTIRNLFFPQKTPLCT
jgi:hypothetical protein